VLYYYVTILNSSSFQSFKPILLDHMQYKFTVLTDF